MDNFLNLQLAKYLCGLVINDEKWKDYLRKKFEEQHRKKRYDFILKIDSWQKKSFGACWPTDNYFKLKVPKSLRFFKRFNFYFKVIFGAFLVKNNGFLLHASVLLRKNRAFVFAGKVGVGKSTIVNLFPEFERITDDAAILTIENNNLFVWGTPFQEKNPTVKANKKFRVKTIYFLSKSKRNKLVKLEKDEAIRRLMANCLVFKPKKLSQKKRLTKAILETSLNTVAEVPCYHLFFKKSRSVGKLIGLI